MEPVNEKHAREARILNRLAGKLKKRGDLPVDEKGFTVVGPMVGYHKLPRDVKRMFAGKTHREKRKLTYYWRGAVAHSLTKHGVTPKGNIPKKKPLPTPSRSVRVRDRRLLNAFANDLRNPRFIEAQRFL